MSGLDEIGSLGEPSFAFIVDRLRASRVTSFVELGSGQSTLRFAEALPDVPLLSVEHDAAWARKIQDDLDAKGAKNARVVHVPLVRAARVGLRYADELAARLPPRIDALLIDGPPFFTLRGREHGLYAIYDRLADGARVFLDDHGRGLEQQVVANWAEVYPGGFTVESVAIGHGLAILEKRGTVTPRWDGPVRRADEEALTHRMETIRELIRSVDDRLPRLLGEWQRAHWSEIKNGYGLEPGRSTLAARAQLRNYEELLHLFQV